MGSNHEMKRFSNLALACLLLTPLSANAFDMVGLISYNMGQLSNPPSNYVDRGNALGYGFLGRLDFGPGQIESGFLYSAVSITTSKSFGEIKSKGSYWMLPLMYRFHFLPPFFSFAAGFDYAVEGYSNIEIASASLNGNGGSSGYRSHFGYQLSLEAAQDLGENLSAVLDLRYRGGLGEAIAFDGQNTKYNFVMISIGLQKHLD
jgi:hypothetical protein